MAENSCNLRSEDCLLTQLISGEIEFVGDSVCIHCHQSIDKIEAELRLIGKQLAESTGRQQQTDDFVLKGETGFAESGGTNESEETIDSSLMVDGGGQARGWAELPDYRVIRELGRGGMGVVYLAEQISLDRLVAIKIVKQTAKGRAGSLERFQAEAKAAARLDHPHIVPVFESGQQGGNHFFVMAFVEGQTLSEILSDQIADEQEFAKMLQQVCNAIQYAHEQGVVHRDLKPSNIIVDTKGEPHVADFGLAKMLDSQEDLTLSGMALGTPAYMPPEQATGRRTGADARNDVYSLGAILYRALTGKPPFHAASPIETLKQVLDKEPVSPSQINSTVNPDLETICLKCLEKDPKKRYRSAKELSEELGRFLDNRPIEARPLSRWERFSRLCQRNPGVCAAVGAVVGSLLIGLVTSVWFAAQATAEASRANRNLDRAEILLYDATMPTAQDLIETGSRSIATARLIECNQELANWEYNYLQRAAEALRFEVVGMAESVTADEQSLLSKFVSEGGCKLDIVELKTGQARKTFNISSPDVLGAAAMTKEGHRIAYQVTKYDENYESSEQTLLVRDVETGDVEAEFTAMPQINRLLFSEDGKQLFAMTNTAIRIFDMATMVEVKGSNDIGQNLRHLIQLDSDELVISSFGSKTLLVWDRNKKKIVRELKGPAKPITAFNFSSRFNRIVATDEAKRVYLWEPKTEQSVGTFALGNEFPYAVCFYGGPNRLLISHSDQKIRVWDTKLEKPVLVIRGHSEPLVKVIYLPKTETLISQQALVVGSDIGTKVWNANKLKHYQRLITGRMSAHVFALSNDGSKIAVLTSVDGEKGTQHSIEIRDLQTFELLHNVAVNGEHAPSWIEFSDAGSSLSWNEGDALRVMFDLESGDRSRELSVPPAGFRDLAYSRSKALVASSYSNTSIEIQDAFSGEKVLSVPIPQNSVLGGLSFSADERYLHCGMLLGGLMRIEITTGDVEMFPVFDVQIGDHKLSPDGTKIAISGGRRIRLLDANSMEVLQEFNGHAKYLWDLSFTPDGKRLASVSEDYSLRVWNVETGKQLLQFNDFQSRPWQVEFSADGKRLVGSSFSEVVVYSIE